MKKILFIGVVIMLFAPILTTAQDTLSRVNLIKAVFIAALVSDSPDTVSGDLYRVSADSTTIMWSESFGFGKVWLKSDPTGFTFHLIGNRWVLILSDEAKQKLDALDEAYAIQILKKLKKKN